MCHSGVEAATAAAASAWINCQGNSETVFALEPENAQCRNRCLALSLLDTAPSAFPGLGRFRGDFVKLQADMSRSKSADRERRHRDRDGSRSCSRERGREGWCDSLTIDTYTPPEQHKHTSYKTCCFPEQSLHLHPLHLLLKHTVAGSRPSLVLKHGLSHCLLPSRAARAGRNMRQ